MARILAAIVLAVAVLIPLSAGALGLGEIDLKSALNQPFSAEIPVAPEQSGDIEGLEVRIASADTFRQFGLDRAAFLADFQVSVVDRATGPAVLITSRQPVVEPFVTLLLEVSWSKGRLLREYTVLLDPPVFATGSVETAVTAPTAGAAVSAPAPRTEQLPVRSTGVTSQRVAPPATVAANDDGTYGPVKRNDTLWTIAGRFADQSASVTRNQMMMAIYQANPEAFNGNINRLKAGMILRVPSAGDIALGARDATAEVRRQNEQWRNRTVSRREEPQGGRLKLVPPPERDTGVVQAGAGESRSGAGSADSAALQKRVDELEEQLNENQRQLQVRDQELEALQRQLAAMNSQSETGQANEQQPELVPEFEPPVAAEKTQPGSEVEAPAGTTEEPESVSMGEDQVSPPAPVDVTPAQPARKDESFLGALFTNPLVYISLAIVLLLSWLFARSRSRSAEPVTGRWDALEDTGVDVEEAHEATTRLRAQPPQDETFVVEEGPSAEGSIAPFADEADEADEDWGGLAEESETPLERTISTDSAVNLDQADPIAEADFHMAYGLYDQAADLLTRAVEIEPERKDLRMKLLEVYFIWENQEGFLQEAEALQQRVDSEADSDWNKVLIMGKQICPDEALFSGTAAPVSTSDSVDLEFGEDGGSDVIDIDFEEDSTGASSVDLEFDEAAAGLDLDLTGEGDSASESAGDSGLIDFDIGAEEDEATQIVDSNDELEMSGDAPTMETPTIESPAMDSESTMETPTLETPTIESPAVDDESTLETPTIESPAMDSESTMETPTLETPVGNWDDDAGAGSGQTAEIDLADLDLDLSSLDGLQDEDAGDEAESGQDDFAADTLEFDTPDDETQQRPAASLDDLAGGLGALDDLPDDIESTAEMQNLDDALAGSGDTVEQPVVGGQDTAEQPGLAEAAEDDFVLDIGEPVIDEDVTVEAETEATGSGIESATMTEVGAKLDLARAYIDMGDPDGARSILNEVLEEAEEDQRQEAQKLLDDLED